MAQVKKVAKKKQTKKTTKGAKSKKAMSYFKTWSQVMFNPLEFFENLPEAKGYRNPTIFALKTIGIMLGVLFIIALVVMAFLFAFGATALSVAAGPEAAQGAVLGMLMGLLIALIIILVCLLLSWGGLWITSGIFHLFAMLFGSKASFKETFRVVCYAIAPVFFTWIPFIGYAASIYQYVLTGFGIHKRHNLSVARSVGVVALPVLIFMGIGLIFYVFFLATTAAIV